MKAKSVVLKGCKQFAENQIIKLTDHPHSKNNPFWIIFNINFHLASRICSNVWFQKISIPPVEGHWKFQGGGGSQRPKFLKQRVDLNWNLQRGGGAQTKKSSVCVWWGRWSMDIFVQKVSCFFIHIFL